MIRALRHLLVIVLLCLAPRAHALEPREDEMERAEAKVVEAKAFFKSGLFAEAADSYLRAYAISHKPATLFNAARAYEEAHLYAKAMALFQQYLELADAPKDGIRDAQDRIARDKALLAQGAQTPAEAAKLPENAGEAKTTEAKGEKPVETGETAKAGEAAKPAESVTAAEPPARWLSWTLFIGGDAIAFFSLLGYIGAVSAVNQANAMDFSQLNAEQNYKTQISGAKAGRTGAVIGLFIGTGLAGWGAWRLWSPGNNPQAPKSARSLWISPSASPGEAGLVLGGRF